MIWIGVALLAVALALVVMGVSFRLREAARLRRDLTNLAESLRIMGPDDIPSRVPHRQADPVIAQVWDRLAALLHEQAVTNTAREDRLRQELAGLSQRCDTCPAEARALSKEAEVGRLKREFLATIHHELLTPMNGILGMIDLAMEDGASPEHMEFCQHARESALILLEIIRDILLLSELEAGGVKLVFESTDLGALLRDLVARNKPAADEKGLELSFQITGESNQWPNLDSRLVARVLDQLVGNAIKFTEAGHVSITAQCAQDEGETLEFLITDTGIGMAPEVMERLFETMGQGDASAARGHGGLGLGLYLVRRLLSVMGGTITVGSAPGLGSTFRVTLPSSMHGNPVV